MQEHSGYTVQEVLDVYFLHVYPIPEQYWDTPFVCSAWGWTLLNVVCSEPPEVTEIFLKYTLVFSKLPEVQDLFLKTAQVFMITDP